MLNNKHVLMALPQQGTETKTSSEIHAIRSVHVLMALPQQGTETVFPTSLEAEIILVLMALPQQGTETSLDSCYT